MLRRDGVPAVIARRAGAVHVVAAALILAVAAFFYTRGLSDWLINDDEEGYLYASWRISQGELPYRDFLTPQLPAFLYPGAVVIRAVGRDPAALRALACALVLAAGVGVFATARTLIGSAAGLAAMSIFLFDQDVAALARTYRPEAFLLAATSLAVYLFVRADQRRSRLGVAAASVLFGVGLLTKLFAVLPWAGLAAYVTFDDASATTNPAPPSAGAHRGRRRAVNLATLVIPGLAVVAIVMGMFVVAAPETLASVLGHHLRQGSQRDALEVVRHSVEFYRESFLRSIRMMVMLPLGVLGLRALGGRGAMAVAWQLPTVLAFLFLRRDLFPERHLVVLLPAAAVTVAAGVMWLVRSTRGMRDDKVERYGAWAGPALGGSLLAVLVVPGIFDALDQARPSEEGTARMAVLFRAVVPPDGRFISDNPGIGFYADRATTPLAAGISEGAVESGQITAEGLLSEPEAAHVALVTMNRAQDGALADLVDFDVFEAALSDRFRRLGHFWRHYQRHDVFLATEEPGLGLAYDWAEVVAAEPEKSAVEAGATTVVDLVLITREVPEMEITALLHLVGPDGLVWADGDALLTNSLHRSSEEFELDEVVAVPLAIRVPPGAAPGEYTIRVGMYETATGERLSGTREGAPADTAPVADPADAFDVARLEVRVPDEPAGMGLQSRGTAGGYSLIEMEAPDSVDAGRELVALTLWRADVADGVDRILEVTVEDSAGKILAVQTVEAPWPTGQWRKDDLGAVPVQSSVPPAAAGEIVLKGRWLETAGGSAETEASPAIELGRIRVNPLPPPQTAPPPDARRLDARVGPVELVAVRAAETPSEDGVMEFTLYWRADAPTDRPYTVLVHAVNATGQVVAQADGAPQFGTRPTTSWRPGEVIADERRIALPEDVEGPLEILVGLYDPADPKLAPLPATGGGVMTPDGRVPVMRVPAR